MDNKKKINNWEKYIGICKNIFSQHEADEITEWMLDIIWSPNEDTEIKKEFNKKYFNKKEV